LLPVGSRQQHGGMRILYYTHSLFLKAWSKGHCTQTTAETDERKLESRQKLASKLFLFGRKNMFKEKKVQDLIPPPSIYIQCVLRTHISVSWNLVHLDSLSPPSVSSRPLSSRLSTPRAVLCVCVYTHTRTHTPQSPVKYTLIQKTPLSIRLSKITLCLKYCETSVFGTMRKTPCHTGKYTVRVSKYHCGQTFSNYLGE